GLGFLRPVRLVEALSQASKDGLGLLPLPELVVGHGQGGPRRGGAAHGASFTRMPWAGRPASSASRAQPSQSPTSFTTLNRNTLIPCFSATGPTVSSAMSDAIERGRRHW